MSEDLDLLRRIATPTRLATYLHPKIWGEEDPYRVDPWLLHLERKILPKIIDRTHRSFHGAAVPSQVGKLLDVDTPMLTANRGWVAMGHIQAGDFVYAPTGEAVKVVAAHEPEMSPDGAYRVTTTDGRSLIAGGEHLWKVQSPNWSANDGWKVLSTNELRASSLRSQGTVTTDGKPYETWNYRYRLPGQGSLQSGPQDLPLDPYVLGVWLGDGSTTQNSLTLGLDDSEEIISTMEGRGVSFRQHEIDRPGWSAVSGSLSCEGENVRFRLRQLGVLGDKHVPGAYFVAGTDQRLDLLRGLMDTDGYAGGKTGCELTLTCGRLARDAYSLILSLGYRATIAESEARIDGRYISQRWRIHFAVYPEDPNPFLLSRKAHAVKVRARKPRCSIASIEHVPDRWMRCITVDHPDGLYLAGRDLVPTHNTSYAGEYLPFWTLGHYPNTRIIFVSYSDNYSAGRGRAVRDLISAYGRELFGIAVDPVSDSQSDWQIKGHRGGMLSVGIGSQIKGRSGDLIILDDLIKDPGEAGSVVIKKGQIDSYDAVIRQRLQPGGTILITATRAAEDDVPGTIMARQREPGYNGDPWEWTILPGIAEPEDEGDVDDPDEWRDEIGRRIGEPLQCRYSVEGEEWNDNHFYVLKRSIAPFTFATDVQQRPGDRKGGLFPRDQWRYYDPHGDLPEFVMKCRVWDLATTDGGGDWTVGTLMGKTYDENYYVLDVQRFRLGSNKVREQVKETAKVRDGWSVRIRIEEEKGGAGKTVIEFYKTELVGFDVDAAKAEGSKESRATPWSNVQQAGHAWLPEDAEWVDAFIDEHAKMMGDGRRPRHDDQIDTAAYCVIEMMGEEACEIMDPNDTEANLAELLRYDEEMFGAV